MSLGLFPIAGAPIADAGGLPNINGGQGSGTSTLTASGQVAGTAVASGTSVGTAAGRVVGNGAISGTSLLTAFQLMAALRGSSLVSAAGQVKGSAAGSGTSLAHAGGAVAATGGAIKGTSTLIAYPFYPAYTDWNAESILFLFSGEPINESDSAFEQAGRIVFCAEKTVQGQQEVWLYWFDPIVGRFIFERICLGSNPRVILDDPLNTVTSDILLFYVTPVEQRVCYRQQRDRYLIEYQTPLVKDPHSYIDLYLQDVVKARDGRLVVIGAQRNIARGQWNYIRLESALYPFVQDPDPVTAAQAFLNTSTLSLVRIILGLDVDPFTANASFQSGTLRSLILFCGPPGTLNPVGAAVPFYDDLEDFQASQAFTSGIFLQVLFPHSLFDVDTFKVIPTAFQSGTLVAVVIVVVLYDIDEFKAASTFIASGSSLV